MTTGKYDIVVMVQGDEPMTTPESISCALEPFKKNRLVNVVNLYGEIFSDGGRVLNFVSTSSNYKDSRDKVLNLLIVFQRFLWCL